MRRTILACVAVALIAGTTSATAATLITSADIKNGTIQASDIRKGTISASRLSSGVQSALENTGKVGPTGKDGATVYGPQGDPGPQGTQGPQGAPGRDGVGLQGADGAPGVKGEKGDKGDKGDAGANGLDSDRPRVVAADLSHGVRLVPNGEGGGTAVDNGTITFGTPPVVPELGTQAARFFSRNGDPAADPDAGRPVVAYLPLTGFPLLSTLTYARYQSFVQDQPQAALNFAFRWRCTRRGRARTRRSSTSCTRTGPT